MVVNLREKKRSYIGRFILYLSILIFVCTSNAQPLKRSIHQYIRDEWKIENGLPQNSVTSSAQTKDGYLWFGTSEGLARFDGIKFTVFCSKNTPQFKTNRILCLLPSRDGSLWIGTEGGGLIRYKEDQFFLYTTENGLTSNFVVSLFQDSYGDIWIGTPDGYLNCYRYDQFFQYKSESGLEDNYIKTIFEDNSGNLWIGTYKGLYLKENNYFKKIQLGIDSVDLIIRAIYQENSGTMWIGSNKGLFNITKNQSISDIDEKEIFLNNCINAIDQDIWGNMWIGTENCLYVLKKEESGNYLITDKILSKTPITDIIIDQEKSIWVTTLGKGIKRFRKGKFQNYTIQEGLSSNLPMSLFEDMNGNLWIGLNNGDVNILDSEGIHFETILSEKLHNNGSVRAICQASNGDIWISSYGNGIYKYDTNGDLQNFTEGNGLVNDIVRTLFIDSSGALWIGTRYGLSIWKNGKFKSYTVENGLPNNIILCINQDISGCMWVGTGKGIAFFSDGQFISKPFLSKLQNYPILYIYPDENNTIWVGTEGGGIFRIKNTEINKLTSVNGLPSNIISTILEDRKGQFWLTTDKGILLTQQEELDKVFDGKKKTLSFRHYSVSNGLASNECVKSSQYAALIRKDHSLWFATVNGLAMINPDNIFFNKEPPPVMIENMYVDGRTISTHINEEVLYVKKEIRFNFTALSFISPHNIRFRYKLDGFDSDWKEIQPGEKRNISYHKLKSGKYTFRVTACNSDGVWNPEGDRINITVKAPFTNSIYFHLLISLFVVTASIFLFLVITRRIVIFPVKKYKKSTLSMEKKEEYIKKVIFAMEKEHIYRDEDVSLSKLSNVLSIPPYHLSQVINEKLKKNFNDLVNSYRIEDAKEKLKDISNNNLTILEIAFDVGFNSKTAFNRAFKKQTGMTPSQFRNKSKDKKD